MAGSPGAVMSVISRRFSISARRRHPLACSTLRCRRQAGRRPTNSSPWRGGSTKTHTASNSKRSTDSSPSLSPVCRVSCPANADSRLKGRHLRRATIVDRRRSSFDPGAQIVGDTGGDQPGPGVEDDDVSGGTRLTGEHATADLGVGEGIAAARSSSVTRASPKSVASTSISVISPASSDTIREGPVVVSSSRPPSPCTIRVRTEPVARNVSAMR